MIPTIYNSFWISTDQTIGAWSVENQVPSSEQLNNALLIKSFFENEGWTLNAICGMLGNMQAESTLNPAFIQATNRFRLPNSANDISDVPNSVMKNFFKEFYQVTEKAFGVGLVQWDGYSHTDNGDQQKLVAYAIRNNYNWYDGATQMYRIRGEWQKDQQYHFFNPVTINGVRYTFDNYVTSTADVIDLAHAWQAGYERNAGGLGFRGTNAGWWFDYFLSPYAPPSVVPLPPAPADPDTPTPVVPDEPFPDGIDVPPIWLLIKFKRRKELKRPCRVL